VNKNCLRIVFLRWFVFSNGAERSHKRRSRFLGLWTIMLLLAGAQLDFVPKNINH